MFGCFAVLSNILKTANDVANVALDWCTDDDIYDEEQQHESGNDVVVPAIVRPHQLCTNSDEVNSRIEYVNACTRNSHSVLAASSVLHGRNRGAWKYSLSS